MSRKCSITGRGVQTGNNVSHAKNRTRRRFLPNMQVVSLVSEALGTSVRLRMSARGLRTITKFGGLDAYLTTMPTAKLSAEIRRLKKRVVNVPAKTAAE